MILSTVSCLQYDNDVSTSNNASATQNRSLASVRSILTTFFRVSRKIHELQHFISRSAKNFPPRQNAYIIISCMTEIKKTKLNIGEVHGVNRVRRIATPHCTGYTRVISRVIPRPWLVAENAVHHESSLCPVDRRDLSLSSRQSRLTDIGEINTKPPAVFFAWKALSRHKLFIAALTRYGRPSRSRGTSSSTTERMP